VRTRNTTQTRVDQEYAKFLEVYCAVLRARNPGRDPLQAVRYGALPLYAQVARFVGEEVMARLEARGLIRLVGDIYGREAAKVVLANPQDLKLVC